MPDITLYVDEDLFAKAKEHAQRHRISLSDLIRELLEDAVGSTSAAWINDCFLLMDKAGADSKGRPWSRKALYNR